MTERGPQGDHGQSGEIGHTGPVGQRGERGQTGLAGLAGDAGERGQTGDTGITGPTGLTGEVGPTGNVGPPVLTRAQTLAMFLFIVAAFVVLAYRTEYNSGRIDDLIRVECEARNVNAARSNAVIDTAIDAETRKPKPDQQRIKDLTNFKQDLPQC